MNDTEKRQSFSLGTLSASCGEADRLGFKYLELKQPLQLNATTEYDIVGLELGMDSWLTDSGTNLSTNDSIGTIVGSVYMGEKGFILSDKTQGASYGPMNFLYTRV